jgi:hypothetical protein
MSKTLKQVFADEDKNPHAQALGALGGKSTTNDEQRIVAALREAHPNAVIKAGYNRDGEHIVARYAAVMQRYGSRKSDPQGLGLHLTRRILRLQSVHHVR